MTTPSRRVLLENYPLYYPFGNTRSTNVFENVRDEFFFNEKDVTKVTFHVLKKLQYISSVYANAQINLEHLYYAINSRFYFWDVEI